MHTESLETTARCGAFSPRVKLQLTQNTQVNKILKKISLIDHIALLYIYDNATWDIYDDVSESKKIL